MELKYGDFAATFEALPETAQHYLITYGWTQAMADAASGAAGNVIAKWVAEGKCEKGVALKDARALEGFAEAEAAEVLRLRTKRFEAILDGTAGTKSPASSGPRTKVGSLEHYTQAAAVQFARGALAAKGKSMPKGKEDIAQLVAALLAHPTYGAVIRDNAKRDFDAAQSAGDLDDIFGGEEG